jgi:uncharacterized integral membrane protein
MNHASTRTSQPIDPIWHVISLDRIWKGLWLGLTIFGLLVIFFVPNQQAQIFSHLLSLFPELLFSALIIFNEIRLRRYWRLIGERRNEAFHNPVPFQISHQLVGTETMLQLPAMLRLRSNSRVIMILIMVLFALLAFFILFLVVSLSVDKTLSWRAILIGLSAFLVGLVIVFFVIYFILLRYRTQIELTEEGISTSYRGQKRSLRWEDAHLFAQYRDGLLPREANGVAFELSNEQTVVRWSQQRLTSRYLKVQSNQSQKADFNELVGLVNAYVARRTGLPLLDLDKA